MKIEFQTIVIKAGNSEYYATVKQEDLFYDNLTTEFTVTLRETDGAVCSLIKFYLYSDQFLEERIIHTLRPFNKTVLVKTRNVLI